MSLLPPWPTPTAPARHALARAAWGLPDGPRLLHRRPAAQPSCPAAAAAPADAALRVERLDAAEAGEHRDAWLDLMGRALEPNVFLDPDFALPAARHLGAIRRPGFVLVWAERPQGGRDLVAVWPVMGRPDPLRALASGWLHDLSTLGFPLLDRACGAAALRALLLWAGRAMPRERGIVFRAVPTDGPTAAVLRDVAAGARLDLAVLDRWERAVLRRGPGRAGLPALSPKSAKDLRRQRRRLEERGTLAYASAREGDALRDAAERFLALEAAGWKGAAGTALLACPGRTAFARTALRLLGRRALCRIDSLTLDGVPIAMALMLSAGGTDFLWKIAYRETEARFSPGVQLLLRITEVQRGGGGAVLTDSCAVPRHPMIDRLWRDRMRLADLAVATRPGRARGFAVAVAAERAVRRLRAAAKRAALAWRGRHGLPAAPDA